VWNDPNIPMYGKPQSEKARHSEVCRLWTESALAGNAYAMAGLALMHRDSAHMPTAVHWRKRALERAEFPEAAYDLGVAYGLNETEGSEAVPVNYEEAAMYYAKVVDMDLGYLKVDPSSLEAKEVKGVHLPTHILLESPSNNEQLGFQTLAKSSLLCIEKYLGNPSDAPLVSHTELSPFVERCIDSVCLLCKRSRRLGEPNMMKCSRCHIAYYCNSICQRGHWPTHKHECRKAG
jgi:hypothetical protein